MTKKRRKPPVSSRRPSPPPQDEAPSRAPLLRYLLPAAVVVAVALIMTWWLFVRSTELGDQSGSAVRQPRAKIVLKAPVLRIVCPFDQSVFPPDIAPTRFHWEDTTATVDRWTIGIDFDSGAPMQFTSATPEWTPSVSDWDQIKQRCVEADATVTVCGTSRLRPQEVLSRDSVSIRTSTDEVGAPIFYREVNLPFSQAIKDPGAHIRWRFGSISSKEQPPVVLEKMPLCGNCHSFSGDGKLIGMDVDYGSDKGSYVICPVSQEMVYDNDKIITWSDYNRAANRGTLGLLSQVSPDGRYVMSTVEDRSVFVAVDGLAFSQLFFPIQGILAYYDRQSETFHALPGADDKRYVQSNPTWSPDGKSIVFARSEAYLAERFRNKQRGLLDAEDVSEFLDGGKTFKFDLWRVPFNDGQGGEPEPILGASNNGMSNYFPKFSPDGKWIVFCQANSFMLLQPDSALTIIPAQGGSARRLECNTSRMNSWHSWSPNGSWLVFSSKAFSPYTQLFLTHVDDQGRTSRPVVLWRFTSPEMAANIPEFVNAAPDAIQAICQQFIDDESYLQAGKHNVREGDYALGILAFQKALELNPKNADAHVAWGLALRSEGKQEEAMDQFNKAISIDPANKDAYCLLGDSLEKHGKVSEAMQSYQRAIEIDPNSALAHQSVGRLLLKTGSTNQGRTCLLEAARLNPEIVSPYIDLASSYLREQRPDQASIMYRTALKRDPRSEAALIGLAMVLLQDQSRRPELIAEALDLATQACKLTEHESPSALIVLADAYAASGQLSEAISVARQALVVAAQSGRMDLVDTIRNLLDQYQQ